MSINPFGDYESQSTRGLQQIDSSKYPDTNKDLQSNLVRLNQFVDYISQYLQTMQKGVDKANQDVLGKLHDFVADMGVLWGGGSAIYGTDLGDLQYFLPALGAMFGFDATTPFPINLFNAVEQFFLGYVVPLDAWNQAVTEQIDDFMHLAGFDEDFINAVDELLAAWNTINGDWTEFLQSINDLFAAIGINPNNPDYSAFADLWNSISGLLSGLNINQLGSVLNPTLHSLAPWIEDLADGISSLSAIIKSWSGGVEDLQGVLNFSTLFGWINFTPAGAFDPIGAWDALVSAVFGNSQQFVNVVQGIQIPLGNLINTNVDLQLTSNFTDPASLAAGGNWTRDGGVGRLAPGSLKGVANGTYQAVTGNAVTVVTGDVVNPEIYVQWSGLSGSGVCMELQIRDNNGKNYTIATVNNPPASGTWVHLQGSFTVLAGISQIKMRLVIRENATVGFVWWDDAHNFKDQAYLPQAWIQDLTTMWNTFLSWFNYTPSTLVNSSQNGNDFWQDVIDFFIAPTNRLAPTTTTNTLQAVNNQIADILQNNIVTPINTAVQDIANWWNGLFGPPAIRSNHTTLVSAITTGASGAAAVAPTTLEDMAGQAVAGLSQTVSDLQTTVQSAFAQSNPIGGVVISDYGPGSNATGAGWGADWTLYGNGSTGNANLNKGFQVTSGYVKGLYNAEQFNTDNQVAGIIFIATPTNPWTGSPGRNRIKLRATANNQNYVYADVYGTGVQLGYTTSGTDHPVGSFISIIPQAGSRWEFSAGDGVSGHERVYKLTQNGKAVATWDDTGPAVTAGLIGASYRSTGQDGYWNGSNGPGKTAFYAKDQIQPLYKAVQARHRNTVTTSSSPVVLAANGIYRAPAGWFNSQDYMTAGISKASASDGYTVTEEGLYTFGFSVACSSGVGSQQFIIAPVVWINSAPWSEGPTAYAYGTGVGSLSVGMTAEDVYLNAGDNIYPAFDTRSGQWNLYSTSNGVASWMQLTKKVSA